MRILIIVCAALAAAALAPAGRAQAWTFKTLYSFCSQNGCADGEEPLAGLLIDASGSLYGTTLGGGKSIVQNGGVVFQLARQGEDWNYSVLYRFCSRHRCNDGGRPVGQLISDIHGALYGTTSVQGDKATREGGTVFRLAPNQDRSSWNFRRLYTFCQHGAGCNSAGPNGGSRISAPLRALPTTFSRLFTARRSAAARAITVSCLD